MTLKAFNIEKGLHDFLQTLKNFNFEKWLHHILMTLKVFQNSYHKTGWLWGQFWWYFFVFCFLTYLQLPQFGNQNILDSLYEVLGYIFLYRVSSLCSRVLQYTQSWILKWGDFGQSKVLNLVDIIFVMMMLSKF